MNNKYVIVENGYNVATNAYYAQTLVEAEVTRDSQTGDWRIFTEVESLSKSRFWRWLTNLTERYEN